MAVGYHKLNSSAARSKRAARNDCAARAMIRDSTEALEIGNADLPGEGQWTGTPETADGSRAPLPVYPPPAESWREFIRDGVAALCCTGLVFFSFVGVFATALYLHGWRL